MHMEKLGSHIFLLEIFHAVCFRPVLVISTCSCSTSFLGRCLGHKLNYIFNIIMKR